MKKILALILSFAVCFGVVNMFGCSNGNYEPVSAQELMQIAEMIESNQSDDLVPIGAEEGYKLTMQMGGSFDGAALNMDIDVQVAKVGESYQFAAVINSGTNVVKTYYKDGYLYGAIIYDGQTQKTKQEYSLNEALFELPDVSEGLLELGDLIEEFSFYGNGFKCYVDRTGENLKAKVEVKFSEMGYTVNMTVVYELDANYRLVGYNADMDIMGMRINANMSPLTSAIVFPNDLDTYGV